MIDFLEDFFFLIQKLETTRSQKNIRYEKSKESEQLHSHNISS